MADNTQIIANTENIEQVVITFANQLNDYIDKMNNDVDKLRGAVGALASGWESEDYNVFASSIEGKMTSIKNELEVAKKLKEYLDDAAIQIREFINTLKSAGNK